MKKFPEGNAIVFCEGAFNTPNGKTAHGLVRRTKRYNILSVIDSNHAGNDSGKILDRKPNNIPVFADLSDAVIDSKKRKLPATHFVIGIAPDGGKITSSMREAVIEAIKQGLHIDSGLHDFIAEDPEILNLSKKYHIKIRDIRKTPARQELHFFDGRIKEVTSLKIAVLGTDSAIGKRTTAWLLVDAFIKAGLKCELVGTGQTAWMQGAKYSLIMDSLINDFVAGEIEYAVWNAWHNEQPKVIVIEGQGSLMNPAYPGGFEILAAGRPDLVILQHAPARKEYDGFPGYPLHPLDKQIEAIEFLSGKPVAAITINHEDLKPDKISEICRKVEYETGLPVHDVLIEGADKLVEKLKTFLKK